jgi:hypothetical protein
LVVLALLLGWWPARADEPDDQYMQIYNLIQQADDLATHGKPTPAKAKYQAAQTALTAFQKEQPDWNPKLVTYRLNYVVGKLTALAQKPPATAAGATAALDQAAPSEPTAAAQTSTTQVKLLEAGAEPRKVLRLHPTAGDKQTLVMTMKMAMETKVGGADAPATKLPAIKMTVNATVKEISENGDITCELVMGEFGVSDEPGGAPEVAEAMKTIFAGVKGLSGTGTVSSRGLSKGVEFKAPAGSNPQARQLMDQMKDLVTQLVAPLPEEAVGPGARWEVKMPIKSQGMTIDQTATYEEVSLDGERLTIKSTIVQHAANQKIQNPAMPTLKMDLTKMVGNGSGEHTSDLTHLLPTTGTGKVHSETSMSMNMGGQKQAMTMKMDMDLRFEAKPPAFAGGGVATNALEAQSNATTAVQTSATQVKLIDAGAEPRKVLRLHPAPDDKQTLIVAMKMVPLSERLVLNSTLKQVADNGTITYEIVLSDLSLGDVPGLDATDAEAMKGRLAAIKGMSSTGTVSSQGVAGELKAQGSDRNNPRMSQMAGQMQEFYGQLVVPLPTEAVGVGAKWQVQRPIKTHGTTVEDTSDYELTAMEGDHLTVKGVSVQSAAKMTGRETKERTLDLAHVLPIAGSSKNHTETDIPTTLNGQKQSMKMDVEAKFAQQGSPEAAQLEKPPALKPEEQAELAKALARAKEKAERISCVNNMKQLGLAARTYADDNRKVFPPTVPDMKKYIGEPKILVCRSDHSREAAKDWASYTEGNCSYEYLAASGSPAEFARVLFRCPIHGTVLLCDGSVQTLQKKDEERLVRRDGKLYLSAPPPPAAGGQSPAQPAQPSPRGAKP